MLATRRKRDSRITDAVLLDGVRYLEALATKSELEPLGDTAQVHYEVPASESAVLTDMGIPLDELENVLMESAAYRQAARVLLPKLNDVKGRPLTPLHGGHVGLLCTAGMLNGVFGEGEDRHIAHWRSVKFTDHWEEEEEDGTKLLHDRERFSHELTLVFANGKTQVLTQEKKQSMGEGKERGLSHTLIFRHHGSAHLAVEFHTDACSAPPPCSTRFHGLRKGALRTPNQRESLSSPGHSYR